MKRKIFCMLLVCMLVAGLAGCGEVYEDTNGPDDYTLQTITDDDIINLKVGGAGISYKESNFMGITSSEYYGKNFNGVHRLFLTNYILPSDVTVSISYINVDSGNFKMIAVLDDEIIQEFPIGTFSEDFYFENIKGAFAIYVAGESAAFEMNYSMM